MTVQATTTITGLPPIAPAQLTTAAFVAVDGADGVTGRVAANALPFLQSGKILLLGMTIFQTSSRLRDAVRNIV